MLNNGQTVMTYNEQVGVISHRGKTNHTKNFCWVKLMNGKIEPIHEHHLSPIDPAVYDIMKGNYDY